MIPALTCLLVGTALGSRFRVTILFAAVPIALALIFGDSMLHQSGFWPAILSATVGSTSLQMGYMLGVFVRGAMIGDDTRRSHERALPLRRTDPTPPTP
jgi:hypothetical protein